MLFNSYSFMIFFPVVFLVFLLLKGRARLIWLLAASCFFYMCWNPAYILLILFSIVVTYLSGILIGRLGRRRWILAVSFLANLSVLFLFKYFNFFVGIFVRDFESPLHLLLPVGISFYTFQALSYTADVYTGKIKPERDFMIYALYVSFFPQLVAGPIERSDHLIAQLRSLGERTRRQLLDFDRIRSGCFLMVWGYFLKMVIADRIAVIADTVFAKPGEYGCIVLICGALAFTIQIYCDFYSYSIIAKGCAGILGVELMDNFDTPYFASSIKDFWRRWHISLSTWFRDYLYIPLGGSRCSRLRKYLNLMITFLVSGLWHGADFTFVIWGGLHGVYQILEDLCKPIGTAVQKILCKPTDGTGQTKLCQPTDSTERSKLCKPTGLPEILNVLRTFLMAAFAWIFFRADSLSDAFVYIRRMVTVPDLAGVKEGALLKLGLDGVQLVILAAALLILFVFDLVQRLKGERVDVFLGRRNGVVQWIFLYLMIMIIVIFGVYGISEQMKTFIYFQF